MALSTSASLSAGVEQIVQLFSSEDFVRQVSEAAGGSLESFTVTGDTAGAFSTVAVRSMPTDRLPDIARKFVGARLNLQQQEQWSAPAADGSREVRISAKISGAPVEAKAIQRIVPDGSATRIDLEGTVTSNIPLFGNKIVQAAEPALAKALNLQVSEARKVLESA